MGKQQVGMRLKEVVYTLSPFEQNVMQGLFKDIPHKVMHHLKQNVLFDALPFCILPIAGIGWFCADYNEREKQHHSINEDDAAKMKEGNNIQVVVRCRPLNQREREGGSDVCVECEGNKVLVRGGAGGSEASAKEFAFDKVFWSLDEGHPSYATQQDVFEGFGATLVDSALDGYNACIFAYGQTGSGKSYSMVGSDADAEHKGLLPRLLHRLFERSGGDQEAAGGRTVDVSMIEIYNERVYDLLDPGVLRSTNGRHHSQSLKVRIHPKTGAYVENLSLLGAASITEALRLIELGSKARTIHATNMNATSSRAHTVFTINLSQKKVKGNEEVEIVSKVNLVDLAGSERTSKTGASGERLREGASINKSLSALGKCISALADMASGGGTAKRDRLYVPYRESTLTLILRESLGGNSRTGMLATISPSRKNLEETLSTLRFASRTKKIVNKAEVNIDPTKKLVMELREEIKLLKEALRASGGDAPPGSQGSALADQVLQSQKIVADLSNTWEDRHQATLAQLQIAKRNMKAMGLVQANKNDAASQQALLNIPGEEQSNGAASWSASLVNLNADPMLSGQLVFHIGPGETRIGSKCDGDGPHFILSGIGIQPSHAILGCYPGADGSVSLGLRACCAEEETAAVVHVNGKKLEGSGETKIFHNARVIFGSYSAFRVNCVALGVESVNPSRDTAEGVAIDWNFAFREYSKTQMDSLLEAKEKELEKKYRDMFERKLDESNAQIEIALEKQCKSLIELQESIKERTEMDSLVNQFERLKEQHQMIQDELLTSCDDTSVLNSSKTLKKAFPEMRTPKKRTWHSAQEAKSKLVLDIQSTMRAIKESLDAKGADGKLGEEDLSTFVEMSLKAMEDWHGIRHQETNALKKNVKENLQSTFEEVAAAERVLPQGGSDRPRDLAESILGDVVGSVITASAAEPKPEVEPDPEKELSEDFLQELTDSILLVDSTNGLVKEVNDSVSFKLRLASALPDHGELQTTPVPGDGEEEHAILIDAFYEGNNVGVYRKLDFEEKASIIEQMYTASSQDKDEDSTLQLHESILEGLPMDKFVGASYVYLKPLLYLMETDGKARILDEYGNKCGDLSVRIVPTGLVDESNRELDMEILDSNGTALLGNTLRVKLESDSFEAASEDLQGLNLFADYRMLHAEEPAQGQSGAPPRDQDPDLDAGPGDAAEDWPPVQKTNRFDIGLISDSMCCFHEYRQDHTFPAVGKEVLSYFENGAIRINVYSKSIADQAMIVDELDRIKFELFPDGVPGDGTGPLQGGAKSAMFSTSPSDGSEQEYDDDEYDDGESDDDEAGEAIYQGFSPGTVVDGVPATQIMQARAAFAEEGSGSAGRRGCNCTLM
ncbi:kinesin [Chloropicon primus]|uniref:Kinesin n=1 Tax=Chloropicon primus TaxID=1764295 RepID=A0A5B8MS15_9CHLO|nr:kinesin [Chloropicon primus]UPR01664.1 kinesin [Chloropicon primus]|eukprot:QDZ22445.1 kinesin [Chloropicon primus]